MLKRSIAASNWDAGELSRGNDDDTITLVLCAEYEENWSS